MIDKSFRVIHNTGQFPVKKKGWMMESGSNWPWHITHWDNWGDVSPKYLAVKDTFKGETQMKILGKEFKKIQLQVKPTGYDGVFYELT